MTLGFVPQTQEDCHQLDTLNYLDAPESQEEDDDAFGNFSTVGPQNSILSTPPDPQPNAESGLFSKSNSNHSPDPSNDQLPSHHSQGSTGIDGTHAYCGQTTIEATSQALRAIADNFHLHLNHTKQKTGKVHSLGL